MKLIAVIVTLSITSCAVFTEPVMSDRVAEQARCLKSPICRTLINDRPDWTERYWSDLGNCRAHAQQIAEQARADGLLVAFVAGDMPGARHVVAVVQGTDGTLWAFDNGRISGTPFPPSELSHWMSRRAWFTNLEDAL